MKYCYNCNTQISEITKEHIPAKCFFEGFPEQYKSNRITVPSCYICNQDYSRIDHSLRDAIAIMNNNDDSMDCLTGKAVRSILKTINKNNNTIINTKGEVVAVKFNFNDIINLQLKNFKGIFFETFKFPLPKEYNIIVIAENSEEEKIREKEREYIMAILMENAIWQKSGNEKIFRYIIKPLDLTMNQKIELKSSKEPKSYAAIIDYYQQFLCLIIAYKI